MEQRESVHRVDGRRPLPPGDRRGPPGGPAPPRRRVLLRPRLHLGTETGDPDPLDRPRRPGPHVPPGPSLLAAERTPLRRPAGTGQARDHREVREGPGPGLAPGLCGPAPRPGGDRPPAPALRPRLRRPEEGGPAGHRIAGGHAGPSGALLERDDRSDGTGRETDLDRSPREQHPCPRQVPGRGSRRRDHRPQHPDRVSPGLRARRLDAPHPPLLPGR